MRQQAVSHSSLFVYFKLAGAAPDDLLATLSAMQARLRQRHPGLCTRLMARTDDVRGAEVAPTWMEVYEHPDGLDAAFLDDLLTEASRLAPGLTGPRHTESFTELAPALANPD